MSELKVNKISPATGTAFTLGDSGDTFTVPSGATFTNSGTATGFGGGKVKQMVGNSISSLITTTVLLPKDDTIPQNTEGVEVLTQAITPTSASNNLWFFIVVNLSGPTGPWMGASLFQDSTAGALASCVEYVATNTAGVQVCLNHKMAAGTTSATTFKVRSGGSVSGTYSINGQSGGRLLGGVNSTSISIMEVEA